MITEKRSDGIVIRFGKINCRLTKMIIVDNINLKYSPLMNVSKLYSNLNANY